MFGLTILGNNSAIPAFDRHPTSQVLTYEDQIFLIDCGEGTQNQLSRYQVRRGKINHIFISHLHGDHYFGLIGLLTSMGLLGREQGLHLYAPANLWTIIEMQLAAAETTLKFPLTFVPLEPGILFESSKMQVSCFPVKHRIPCFGFLFKEKKQPRKLIPELAIKAGIPPDYFHQLQMGKDFPANDGTLIKNSEVTLANSPARMYAYSADTVFDENICTYFSKANLLYHEATYLHNMAVQAAMRFHTTARQAALIAEKAGVKKLLIGHFSSKYENLQPFLLEVSQHFSQAELAMEGVTYLI